MQWSEAIRAHLEAIPAIAVNQANLQKLWQLLDLTSLNEDDTEASIAALLEKAASVYGFVSAVCVYPRFVRAASAQFANKPVRVATVANFPKGDKALDEVIAEISQAMQMGANEIDVVFPYERYLAGETEYARTFVAACKAACGADVTLKVILETGALNDYEVIADAAYEVLSGGADFIKTSTGKFRVGATLEVACVLLLVIRHMAPQLKRTAGLKVAGGIRDIQQALTYVALADHVMGQGWATTDTFRIGASKLADEMLQQGQTSL